MKSDSQGAVLSLYQYFIASRCSRVLYVYLWVYARQHRGHSRLSLRLAKYATGGGG
jgi:hypothetical protein